MTTLILKSVGQLLIEAVTVAAIDLNGKTATGKYACAQVALQVASAFTALSTGDLATALATAQAALIAKVTDPGQIALTQALFTLGNAQLTVVSQAASVIPLLNATAQGVAGEIAAGITAVASAYPNPTVSA